MPPFFKSWTFLKPLNHETLLIKPREAIIPNPDSDVISAMFRIALAWLAIFFGEVTLQNVGILLAIIFTTLQIIALLKREFGLFQRNSKESK